MGIPIMSNSLMLADGFDDTPAMLDEKRKHCIIQQMIGEVNWSGGFAPKVRKLKDF